MMAFAYSDWSSDLEEEKKSSGSFDYRGFVDHYGRGREH
jgi:hypothetical protein